MSAGIGGINVDGAAAAAAGGGITNINVSAGTTSNNLSNVVFSNSNSVSFGLNGSTVTGSIPSINGATGLTVTTAAGAVSIKPVELSVWRNFQALLSQGSIGMGNSSVSIQPFVLQWPLAFSNIYFPGIFIAASTNNTSSIYFDLSMSAVFYSRNVSTLSYITSFSNTFTSTYATNVSVPNGVYAFTMSNAAVTTLTPGEYFVAFHLSTTNTATNASTATTTAPNSVSLFLGYSIQTNNQIRALNPTSNSAFFVGILPGAGCYVTNATRSSLAFTDYSASASASSGYIGNIAFELRNATYWG